MMVWVSTAGICRLRLYGISKWNRSVELRSLACRSVNLSLHLFVCIVSFASPALRFEFGVECADSQILFQRYTIAAFLWEGIVWRRYLQIVRMLLAEHIFEEGINVHSSHPSLQFVST